MILPILLSIGTVVSTFLGGLVALRYRDKPHLILGFTAGVLLGVVSFDILPEIMHQVEHTGIDPIQPMIALVIGFLVFHIVEKIVLVHAVCEDQYEAHHHPHVGILSALALIGHSFIDGIGIGLAFQVNEAVGIIVALAVISHDFSDGLNTVTLLLRNGNSDRQSYAFLALDALAPVIGAVSTLFFTLPEGSLLLYLGAFAGFLLYIGASEILPEAHSRRPSLAALAMTVAGTVFSFAIISAIPHG
jgi:zinc transporter ZupT